MIKDFCVGRSLVVSLGGTSVVAALGLVVLTGD